ncbi:MAG: chromosome segregation protein SMC [Saprospiraceae bacterium]|nr:chromosome segregation protein SMC [Saprospiraceae bacterium]MBP6565997.1 chromosome segregation protein SMC [Saprospiraceae bacterium]
MRLKSLHIKGFKSFANETILNFSEDVIGVVGPNGSGKSNIVDAIRWVLGEQKSKELRLEAMSDVIFNGTKTKKEAATATVALTFDNTKNLLPTEYQTVTISRTLFRSGESEYRLNNVSCRLKDINSLFLDTGIGSNSYAIIALGMVDDILADKENSRRRMFEQAAGVSKYKIRKRETLNKLKGATEDLNRIDDLLFEIEGNLKSLEKQAKRTQKYFDLKGEYKELSIKHAVISIHHLKQKYKGISDQLVKDQDIYRENDSRLYKFQALLEKEKKANSDKENALSDHQKKLNELVYQIRTREGDKGLLTQKIGFKKQNKEQLTRIIGENELELEKAKSESILLQTRIVSENEQLDLLKSVLSVSKETYDLVKSEYNTAKLSFDIRQKEKQDLERQLFDFEKTIAIYKNSIENFEREALRIKETLSGKEKENTTFRVELDALSENLDIKNKELSILLQNENNRKLKIAEKETKREKLNDELNKINRNIDSKQNEYDLLKSMIDNFEGFPESIKFLNEHWRKDLVILSDILDVQEKYKAPVELFLDHYLNYFIVDTINDGIQGITLLKNSQKGKAHFFLLDRIPSEKITQNVDSDHMIKAIDVVSVQDKYTHLIASLLGNVLIFDGEVDQFQGAEKNTTVISSNGTFLQQGFSISGGSVGLFEGKKIGRKQNLEKLALFLDENNNSKILLNEELKGVKKELESLKSSDYNALIEKLKKEVQRIEQDKIRLQHQMNSFEQLKAESENKIKLSSDQVKELMDRISLADQQMKSIRTRIINLDKPEEGKETDIDILSERMSNSSEQFNNDNINLIRHQNLIGNFVKDKEFRDLKISELTIKTESDRNKLLAEDRERIDIEDQLIKIDTELQILYVEKKNFQSSLGEAEQDYFKAKNTITELDDQIRSLTKDQSQLQQSIQNMKDQFTEQKFQIQSVGERLRIEFNVSINDIINQEADKTADYQDLSEELEKLKVRMQSYGDINPLAVDAFNEMKQRYDNINIQRKDILEAKDSLMDTIKEIESTATHQFMDAFTKVRENFIEVFRSLFTEDDTCDLVLLDPSNPLESEIEIIAKPKGKKPKSLSQLSGGEKTLTATALLFALYLLKPAPFCIFDEVDAPLDDANIQKFNKIIQKFSKDSQFIIVTHNKSTMAEVDVLYGVYMIEPGVSGVSAVDFRSLKHEPVIESLN